MLPNESNQADEVLATLRGVMESSESDSARIQAAKILLERLRPKEDNDELKRQEAEERDAALAEAHGLLAEFAAIKLASLHKADDLDQRGKT